MGDTLLRKAKAALEGKDGKEIEKLCEKPLMRAINHLAAASEPEKVWGLRMVQRWTNRNWFSSSALTKAKKAIDFPEKGVPKPSEDGAQPLFYSLFMEDVPVAEW